MLELGSSGSVRGVLSNEHPYREPGPSCGQYEDMPPAFKCPPDGSSGLTDLPVGLAVTVTPPYAVNPRCLTVYFRIGSSASDMRRRFSERGTRSGSTESAI